MFKLIKIIVTILFAFRSWMFHGISSVDFTEVMAALQYQRQKVCGAQIDGPVCYVPSSENVL